MVEGAICGVHTATARKDDRMTTSRRSLTLAALLGAGALLLAGCATGSTGPASGGSSAPTASTELELQAGWLDGGRQIALVTQGSSSCVPMVSDATLQADGTLAISLEDAPADQVCTADFAPRVSLAAAPEGVDATKALAIVVTDAHGARGEVELAGATGLVAPTENAPSAGWVSADSFALLTWGSSSCAPVVQDVAASAPTSVTVTFATPPADQMCTMDMAPRVALVSTAGLTVDATGATVTLTGGDAQFATPVTVPIIG